MDARPFVGIDVGGARKGFHGVVLKDTTFVDCRQMYEPGEVRNWVKKIGAHGIAVDSPCRWSASGRARAAERELAKMGMSTFATPSRAKGESHVFYEWMVNGMALYSVLEMDFPLFAGDTPDGPFCAETFPHAVVCALAGRILPAKSKKVVRSAALQDRGFDTTKLLDVDLVDAALCAVAAQCVATGTFDSYGDGTEGFIVTPKGLVAPSSRGGPQLF